MLAWNLSKVLWEKMLLFDLDAQFVGVGLNPSLSLFLLVTVTGEKESAAAMLDCFKWIT
jgi:hypothetical protein